MSRKNAEIIIFVVIIAIAAALYFTLRNRKVDNNIQTSTINPTVKNQSETAKVPIPENNVDPSQVNPVPGNAAATPQDQTDSQNSNASLPERSLLDMPFYSQAPLSKWDAFHEEMCEEASLLNAGLYLEDKKLTKDQFEGELQKIQRIEKSEIGEWKSTTAAQTKKWADVYFEGNVKIKIIENPTIKDIEKEISDGLPAGEAGHPVIVPLSGRDIGNPNFTPPGPIYHMLVIKGYDSQNFITNDVGTRKGNSYAYKKEVIMKNMHDWNEKDIHLGAKRVLVLMIN